VEVEPHFLGIVAAILATHALARRLLAVGLAILDLESIRPLFTREHFDPGGAGRVHLLSGSVGTFGSRVKASKKALLKVIGKVFGGHDLWLGWRCFGFYNGEWSKKLIKKIKTFLLVLYS